MATGGFVEGILKSFSSNVPPDFYVLPNTVSNIVSDFTGGAINLGKEMKKLIISNQNEIKK